MGPRGTLERAEDEFVPRATMRDERGDLDGLTAEQEEVSQTKRARNKHPKDRSAVRVFDQRRTRTEVAALGGEIGRETQSRKQLPLLFLDEIAIHNGKDNQTKTREA